MSKKSLRKNHRRTYIACACVLALVLIAIAAVILLLLPSVRNGQEDPSVQVNTELDTQEITETPVETVSAQQLPAEPATEAVIDVSEEKPESIPPDAAPAAASDEEPTPDTPSITQSMSVDEIQALIDAALPGIVCWGDSITEGYLGEGKNYPARLKERIDSELIDPIRTASGHPELKTPSVVNMGVSGEPTVMIAARNGSIPMKIDRDFVIPAECEEVGIDFSSSDGGKPTKPLLMIMASEGGVNDVTIAGVRGRIIRYYDTAVDHSRYLFVRNEPGEAVAVSAGEPIITAASHKYRNYLCVILMGANGLYDSPDHLRAQFQAIIDHQTSRPVRYLCIGMGQEGESNRSGRLSAAEAGALKNAFGDRFIDLGTYMSQNGLALAGIQPTAEDQRAMDAGAIPPSLLHADGLHYSPAGYAAIGDMVYEKLLSLGEFDGLRDLARR